MRITSKRELPALCLALCLCACGEGGSATSPIKDASTKEPHDSDTSSVEEGVHVDANSASATPDASTLRDAGSYDAQARTDADLPAQPSDGGPDTKRDAQTTFPIDDAGVRDGGDAEFTDDGGDEPDSGVDIGEFVDRSGVNCHEDDANGAFAVQSFPASMGLWPAANGGAIAPGTYIAIAAEQVVGPGADATQAAECMSYSQPYRETLVITAARWSRVYQSPPTEARSMASYVVEGNMIHFKRMCPTRSDAPAEWQSPYAAVSDKLFLFDTWSNTDGGHVCDYLYQYQRMP